MLLFMEKMLEFSMRLGKSRNRAVRMAGRLIGTVPLRCAEYLEKLLMSGKWNPGKKRKKRKYGDRSAF